MVCRLKNDVLFIDLLINVNCYQVAGCCGTYTVNSRADTCIQQIRKNVGNMNVLVSTRKVCLCLHMK